MKKYLIIFIVVIASVLSGQSKVGSSAAPFLTMAVGSKATAMGGAFVATADDISAIYWNPAGISRLQGNGVMFSRTEWFADISYNWAAGTVNLGNMGALGLSVMYLDYGDIEVTTMSEQEGTGEFFNPSDMAIGLTYAYNLTDRFSIGGTAKYIQQSIYKTSASTVAFDLGVLYYSDIYGLRIGASITNFGDDMQMDGQALLVQYDIDPNIEGNNDEILAKLETDEFPLPLTFRVGVAMDVIDMAEHRLTLAVDASHPNDNDESINVGAEYTMMNLFSVRGGYRHIGAEQSQEGLTLGAGINYELSGNLGITFDYTYQELELLDEVQHMTIGLRF